MVFVEASRVLISILWIWEPLVLHNLAYIVVIVGFSFNTLAFWSNLVSKFLSFSMRNEVIFLTHEVDFWSTFWDKKFWVSGKWFEWSDRLIFLTGNRDGCIAYWVVEYLINIWTFVRSVWCFNRVLLALKDV